MSQVLVLCGLPITDPILLSTHGLPMGTHEYLEPTITNAPYIPFSVRNLIYITCNNLKLGYFFILLPFRPLVLVPESCNDFVTRDCWWEITP
jgi:hypothetical protein